MRCDRPWIVLLLAVWTSGGAVLRAQDLPSSGGTSDSSSTGTTGASSSFGSPSSSPTPGSTTTTPSSSFGPELVPPTSSVPSNTVQPGTAAGGASSSFGGASEGGSSGVPLEAPTTFVIPGSYGSAPQVFVAGQGRLAKPRYKFTGSLTLGLDDNVLSTPFNGQEIPAQRLEVVDEPARAERTYVVIIPPGGRGALFPDRATRIVVTEPARDAKTHTEVLVPGRKPEDRIASVVARATVGAEVQFASRKTLFTMDVRGSGSAYSNRPGDKTDVNGSLSFAYLYRLTPRVQFTATANMAYLSQPDIRRPNTPINNVGDYFNGTFRTSLSYRLTKRLSTIASYSLNGTSFTEKTEQLGDFYESIFGVELRYLMGPRLTVLGEVRYSMVTYANDVTRDSTTITPLIGAELALTRQIGVSARLGAERRAFAEQGDASIGPFAETSLSWRYNRAGALTWTTRFGFEEPPNASTTVQTFRSGINLVQAFSARLRATGGFTYLYSSAVSDLGVNDVTNNSFSLDAGMEYTLSRHMTLTGTYSLTTNLSSFEGTDYIRNQIFFGVQYSF